MIVIYKMRHIVSVGLLILFIASCNNAQDPLERINTKLKLDGESGFRKDLPELYNDSSAYWPFIKERRSKLIGLPVIENGSDQFQIRIWEETDSGETVLLITHEDSGWTAKSYIYEATSVHGLNNIDSFTVSMIYPGKPKSGWNEFLNKLIDIGILELKDESKIPGYSKSTDRRIISVEIASKNYYRYYQLSDVHYLANKIEEAGSMAKVLDLIELEFPQLQKTNTDQ